MIEIKVGTFKKSIIKHYESIYDLPIDRKVKFDQYLAKDMGIGSNMDDVNNHFQNLFASISAGENQKTLDQATNMYYGYFNMINGIDTKSLCMMALIYSINDEELDLKDESKCYEKLQKTGIKYKHLSSIIEDTKKKLMPN